MFLDIGYDEEDIGYDDDEVGDVLVGEDEVEELLSGDAYEVGAVNPRRAKMLVRGRRPAPPARRAGSIGRATAMAHQRNVAVVKPRTIVKPRYIYLGFPATAVAAAAAANIVATPQVLFRPERLLVPSDIAGDFTIDQIIVGKDNSWAAAGAVPARAFQENATPMELGLDTAQPNTNIILQVTNIAAAQRTFRAALAGQSVQ